MDGDGERNEGGTAENWSRRDGIRAGAVSGPWRSTPRAGDAPPPDHAPEPPRRIERAQPRRRHWPAAVWIGLGSLAAIGCVVAAVLLRPDGVPSPATTPEVESVQSSAEPAVGPDPALAAAGNVRLRVPDDMPQARRDAIVAALGKGGIEAVQVEALPFAVESARVGYYLERDRAAAEALARLAAPLVTPGGTLAVRDYGKLLDNPEPGRLDLWVGN